MPANNKLPLGGKHEEQDQDHTDGEENGRVNPAKQKLLRSELAQIRKALEYHRNQGTSKKIEKLEAREKEMVSVLPPKKRKKKAKDPFAWDENTWITFVHSERPQ